MPNSSFNSGNNLAQAVNFADGRWLQEIFRQLTIYVSILSLPSINISYLITLSLSATVPSNADGS